MSQDREHVRDQAQVGVEGGALHVEVRTLQFAEGRVVVDLSVLVGIVLEVDRFGEPEVGANRDPLVDVG
jgi:hypothetical protein